MAQQVSLAVQPDDLSSILGTHIKGQMQWPPSVISALSIVGYEADTGE